MAFEAPPDMRLAAVVVTFNRRAKLVTLSLEGSVDPAILLYGWVTRHRGRGFAIEFDELDRDASVLVDDVAALVNAERR